VNCPIRSRTRNRNRAGPLSQVHQQVAGLLHRPCPVRVRGHAQDMGMAGGRRGHEEHVTRRWVTAQSAWKKSHARIVAACVRKCRQVVRWRCGGGRVSAAASAPGAPWMPRPGTPGRAVRLGSLLPPAPRYLLAQHRDPDIDRRPPSAAGIGPPPADQTPVPAQQRVRRSQAAHPQRPREQPRQDSEHRPVGQLQPRSRVLPWQRHDLLAQHQQIGVLLCGRTRQQRDPPGQQGEYQIQHSYRHKPAILPAQGRHGCHTRRSATSARLEPLRQPRLSALAAGGLPRLFNKRARQPDRCAIESQSLRLSANFPRPARRSTHGRTILGTLPPT